MKKFKNVIIKNGISEVERSNITTCNMMTMNKSELTSNYLIAYLILNHSYLFFINLINF